jgi:hypothetical protein
MVMEVMLGVVPGSKSNVEQGRAVRSVRHINDDE